MLWPHLAQLVYPCLVTLLDSPINILLCRYIPERKLKYFTGGLAVKSAYLILKWTKHYLHINSIKYLHDYLPLYTSFIPSLKRFKSSRFSMRFSPINNCNLNMIALLRNINQHLPRDFTMAYITSFLICKL